MKTAFLNLMIFAAAFTMSGQELELSSKCTGQEEFQLLRFWIGSWEVYAGDQKIGENTIEWVLNECAIMEHWKDGRGQEGKSLFYYYPAEGKWKQVWVTANPFRPGGVKEKTYLETLEDGSVVFQGEVTAGQGNSYLDRTTLTPLASGDVIQKIDVSGDDGQTWKTMFQAVYRRSDETGR